MDAGTIKFIAVFAITVASGTIVILKYFNSKKPKKESKGIKNLKQLDYCKQEFKNLNLIVNSEYQALSEKLRDMNKDTDEKIKDLLGKTETIETNINRFEREMDKNKSDIKRHDEKLDVHNEKITKIENHTNEFKVFEAKFETEIKYIKEGVHSIKDAIKDFKDLKLNFDKLLEMANRRREDYE